MALLRKIGRAFAVLAVVMLAVAAGLFLSACKKAEVRKAADSPATEPATQPAAKSPAATQPKDPSATRPVIDVTETQKGQPIPRNLLE